jgi:hypothetical protein
MSGVDPHAVLGVQPGASPAEVAAAYRRLAKEWHPDVAGAAAAVARMAEINAAYAALRDGGGGAVNGTPGGPGGVAAAGARRAPAGAWLAEDVRRALGRELLAALEPGEPVELVTPAATWASPQSVLVLTDRRLLWLLDDAPTNRVRSLRFRDVAGAERRLTWPRRRRAELRVHTRGGRRHAFADLGPAVADAIARRVADAATMA